MAYAHGTLGGATTATSEIVRTALQVTGTAPNVTMVSSFFLMLLCREHHDKKGAIIFSDAGLVIDPNSEELADIAIASAGSFAALVEETPKIAMLSFSTLGSARHASVSKVADATEKVRAKRPDILLEGELQFDAAFVPEVAASKAPGSAVAGQANVLIFPNLDAGNIGYKIAQRIGGANAIGPILQGLAHPANDLSRGCSAEDVMHMIAVTAVQ
ncbi:MAG: phosphate acyltransferase [Roseobacter sp.]